MRHVIVGMGEVGKALHEVLGGDKENLIGWADVKESYLPFDGRPDALHVAIPYSSKFEEMVNDYIKTLNPKLVIVHSSVPVGTCDTNHWIHSPIRGVHPNIAKGIMTFTKYFGGLRSEEAADLFSVLGIKTVAIPHARDCEAAKLWDTTQYGWMIVLAKSIHAWCKENHADFEFVYKEFNRTYNEGYAALGRSNVQRPLLNHVDGPIGGHCVIPNLPLLGDNEITEFIDSFNKSLEIQDLAISGEQQ
jgi:hypothetical protein